ncbi:iron-containing alcohol dehydrogenase [Alteraurantiacibacter aquimixticola]|uniref:Alcohol dehydrogenase 2 n=1 Tax=Alteraurantiacibacter aquimixticola TaxID=2489173 RepID=A0A4T3F6W2_9SPHN|nr:iron-containing alcohol dehydrogenase [Alteraurantiacibacter aquimixticola]TIX51432.1 iron-containing alcohol dehydrogenase [Alteraurantiacibacter aquimixticola]
MTDRERVDLYQVGCVRIGAGTLANCADDCAQHGAASAMIATSAPILPFAEELAGHLRRHGIEPHIWTGPDGEPTRADLRKAIDAANASGVDFVVGLGGGSAMDVAKLVAALLGADQSFDEVVGTDLLNGRNLPLACIPTTAGTGSEVTPIAILEDEQAQLKKGVVSRHLVPDYAYLDARLTVTMPRHVTAATGLDALTHCIEAYANKAAYPVVDAWALEGIRLIVRNLERACDEPDDLAAREAMLIASHLGGMCLGPVNTAAVHALAYPLGGEFHVPHGVANSLLLPHVIRFNAGEEPRRYAEIARAMGLEPAGSDAGDAEACIAEIERLSSAVGIDRRLSDLGISSNAIPKMAAAAMTVQRLLKNNPREVTETDALRIYEAAL